MAKVVEEHWWVPGEAERHVRGCGMLLRAECGEEWGWAMGWAESVLGEMGEVRRGWEEAKKMNELIMGMGTDVEASAKHKGKGRARQLGKEDGPRLERWRSH